MNDFNIFNAEEIILDGRIVNTRFPYRGNILKGEEYDFEEIFNPYTQETEKIHKKIRPCLILFARESTNGDKFIVVSYGTTQKINELPKGHFESGVNYKNFNLDCNTKWIIDPGNIAIFFLKSDNLKRQQNGSLKRGEIGTNLKKEIQIYINQKPIKKLFFDLIVRGKTMLKPSDFHNVEYKVY